MFGVCCSFSVDWCVGCCLTFAVRCLPIVVMLVVAAWCRLWLRVVF